MRQAAEAEADTTELSRTVEDLLDRDPSFAEANAKRQRLVTEAFQKEDLETTVCIVDFLLQPLDAITNKMLRRTTILKKLRYRDIQPGESLRDLKEASKTTFLAWASGDLGVQTLRAFLHNIRDEDLTTYCRNFSGPADTVMAKTCFQLTVFGLTDTWRRFCLPAKCFPWNLFQLLTKNETDFCVLWDESFKTLRKCPQCVDGAFSSLLLSANLENLQSLDPGQRAAFIDEVQKKLLAISVFCPLASDTVENLHGQNQFNLHSWRGKAKATPAAAETSVLKTLASEHAYGKSLVHDLVMPAKTRIAQMMRRIGTGPKRAGWRSLNHKQRLRKAASVNPRKLSAWNVYFRQNLKECQKKLPKDEFRRRSRQWGRQWRHLPSEEQQKFKIDSEYEQSCREELATRGLHAGDRLDLASEGVAQEGGGHLPADALSAEQLELVAGRATVFPDNVGLYPSVRLSKSLWFMSCPMPMSLVLTYVTSLVTESLMLLHMSMSRSMSRLYPLVHWSIPFIILGS